ncbi:VOC family protein [Nocardioides sp.]|uniref:VOC family protein n=1 Tax=Nocardioides sp. TaxID=35761 RepID=UPI0039E4438F
MIDWPLTHLRHVDLAVPDFKRQVRFYTEQWGLTQVAEDGGVVYLAAAGSPEQYSVRLRKDEDKRLDLISFGARDEATVVRLAQALAEDGVKLVSEPDKLQTPGGGFGFRFFDCDGRTVEISSDVETRVHRKVEQGEDIPVRLSHAVFNSLDINRTRAFYERHFDFKLTDTLAHPSHGELLYFMRTSPTHHSIGIAKGPYTSLNHISFEMRGIDEYMRGSGRLMRAGVQKLWGPGRHRIGQNTFSYFLDPHGNVVEYTTELELVDEDSWHPSVFDATDPKVYDQWGTAGPAYEVIYEQMMNEQDDGLFVAPPV